MKTETLRGEVVRRILILRLSAGLTWNALSRSLFSFSLLYLPFSSFAAVFMLLFFFCFFNCSKSQPHCWCILEMIIHWDWASVAEHAQGSLITPAVIDKNKRSGRRREARIPPSYNKEHRQILKHTTTTTHLPLTSSTADVQPACREDCSILISPWETDILRHIDHTLLTAVINSDNSELNEKFYFCLSAPLLLSCIRCPPPPTSTPLLLTVT